MIADGCLVCFVRHGETVGASSIRLWGSTDVALSELGREQIRSVRELLRGQRFDRVFTSPLSRARESADILAGAGAATVVVDDFREIDFGEWEGLTAPEIAERDPEGHAAWQRGGADFQFPNGDCRRHFKDRVCLAFQRSFADAAGCCLVVAHTGVIRTLIAHLLGLDASEERALVIGLGSIYRLERRDGGWTMSRTSALEP
jgi:broad specificity phosphatase PhoE